MIKEQEKVHFGFCCTVIAFQEREEHFTLLFQFHCSKSFYIVNISTIQLLELNRTVLKT